MTNARPNTIFDSPAAGRWQTLLARFDPISLAQMNSVALLDRTDTKFVLAETQLHRALTTLRWQYRVLDISGIRLNHYQTLYFDTADFALYRRHHAGGRNRYKVRSREDLDSHLSFLEIKHKVDDHRTIRDADLIAVSNLLDHLISHDYRPVFHYSLAIHGDYVYLLEHHNWICVW